MDDVDRRIVNALQDGIAIEDRPFLGPARALGISEDDLLERVSAMLEAGVLSRFGPMFDAEQMGGAFCLCAMSVPAAEFDRTVAIVNAFPEVAHNYEREHHLNMWFVLATEHRDDIEPCIAALEEAAGFPVLALPKLDEFFVGLRLEA